MPMLFWNSSEGQQIQKSGNNWNNCPLLGVCLIWIKSMFSSLFILSLMSLFWKKEIILIMPEIVSCIAPPLPTPYLTQPSIHLYPARMFLTWVLLFAWDRISRQDARKFSWAVGLKFLMTRVESSNPALDSNHFSESHQQRYTVKILILWFYT